MSRIVEYDRQSHPPPEQARRSLAILLFALFGAPAAWSAQLIANYAITADACFPNDVPLPFPAAFLPWDRQLALAINILALLIGAAATWTALGVWRRERGPGSRTDLSRTRDERICFMALSGLMTGFGFMAATLFNTVAALGVPQCSG
jgi:hypothetical protein